MAAEFYGNLFQTKGVRVSPGRHYFHCGSVILACYDPRADGDDFDAKPNPDHIYFSVENLDEFFLRCKSAGFKKLDNEIIVRPWGEKSFYCIDPFGNPLCFVDS